LNNVVVTVHRAGITVEWIHTVVYPPTNATTIPFVIVTIVVSVVVNLLISRVRSCSVCVRGRIRCFFSCTLVDDGQCTLPHSCTPSDDFSSTLQHARPLQTLIFFDAVSYVQTALNRPRCLCSSVYHQGISCTLSLVRMH